MDVSLSYCLCHNERYIHALHVLMEAEQVSTLAMCKLVRTEDEKGVEGQYFTLKQSYISI
jgi:hypothetical protein